MHNRQSLCDYARKYNWPITLAAFSLCPAPLIGYSGRGLGRGGQNQLTRPDVKLLSCSFPGSTRKNKKGYLVEMIYTRHDTLLQDRKQLKE